MPSKTEVLRTELTALLRDPEKFLALGEQLAGERGYPSNNMLAEHFDVTAAWVGKILNQIAEKEKLSIPGERLSKRGTTISTGQIKGKDSKLEPKLKALIKEFGLDAVVTAVERLQQRHKG